MPHTNIQIWTLHIPPANMEAGSLGMRDSLAA